MKTCVISLGGSVFIPSYIDYPFLERFRKLLLKFKKYKFVIVLGGGGIARKYIGPLKKRHVTRDVQSKFGVETTRLNALFLMKFFGDCANDTIPKSMKHVKNLLAKNHVVFCGGLRFVSSSTSDGTAASLAHYFGSEFINMTDVDGLYTQDPNRFKKTAKFIPEISFNNFNNIIKQIKYKPGQHFVLDQLGSMIIKKYKVKTIILNGHKLKNFENYLKGKSFRGTVVC